MKSKQHGFTVIEILFFILLVAVLVGGAYFVGNRNKTAKNKTANSLSDKASPASDSADKTFKSTEFGFQFQYPAAWGKADLNSGTGFDGKGAGGTITFSSEEGYHFSFISPDYERAGVGGGCLAVIAPNNFEAFKSLSDADSFIDVKVDKPGFSVMYGGSDYLATDTGCPSVMAARKKLVGSKIDSVDFSHFRDNQFKNAADIAKYSTNPTLFFPQADQDTFMKVALSITEVK
jgi:hypothetical protein